MYGSYTFLNYQRGLSIPGGNAPHTGNLFQKEGSVLTTAGGTFCHDEICESVGKGGSAQVILCFRTDDIYQRRKV